MLNLLEMWNWNVENLRQSLNNKIQEYLQKRKNWTLAHQYHTQMIWTSKIIILSLKMQWDRCGHDHMVVGFTLPIHSMPITTKVVSSNPAHGEVYSM